MERKYDGSPQQGLPAWYPGSPQERSRAITAIGGDYTLDDYCSPDLDRVIRDIASDRKATRRRTRAAALIATLGRAWGSLGDRGEVAAAQAYYSWNRKGDVRAWWLWHA